MTDDAPQGDPPAFRSNDGLGPLPDPPTFYRYQFQAHYGPVWRSSAENWNGCPPLASEGLYSAEQMRAYAAQQVAAERERCAKVCEEVETQAWALWKTTADPTEQGRSIGAQHCADAIRAERLN